MLVKLGALNRSHEILIDFLITRGFLKSLPIIEAFQRIRRFDFVLPGKEVLAVLDEPLSIGEGQTISQPATVAIMFELLQPKKHDIVLDIGSGSGWTTALLADIVGVKGRVYGVEILPDLHMLGERNLTKYGFLKKGFVENICGNGYSGLPEKAPFDKIMVSAATKKVPEKLIEQLKIGGRLIIPLGKDESGQDLVLFTKVSEGKYTEEHFPGYVFVPLVNPK